MVPSRRGEISESNREILESDAHYEAFLRHLGEKHPQRALVAVAAYKLLNEQLRQEPNLHLTFEFRKDWDYDTNIVELVVSCKDCDSESAVKIWNRMCSSVYQDLRGILGLSTKQLTNLMHHVAIQVTEGESDE